MKRFTILFICILVLNLLRAQSVGIGTSTPNAKAALDISCITRSILSGYNNSDPG